MNAKVGSLSFREQAGEQQYYRPHSDQMTDLIDSEVRALIDKAYQSVTALLIEHREKMDEVAELLLEKEVIGHEDMTAILGERAGQHAAYDYATLAQVERGGSDEDAPADGAGTDGAPAVATACVPLDSDV